MACIMSIDFTPLGFALGVSIFFNILLIMISYITQDYMKEKKAFAYIAETITLALLFYVVVNLADYFSTLSSFGISTGEVCNFPSMILTQAEKTSLELEKLQKSIRTQALMLATTSGMGINIMNFPVIGMIASLFNVESKISQLTALYNYLEGAKVFVRASAFFLSHLVYLSPTLLAVGLIIRSIPFFRSLGGFTVAFAFAFGLVYPLAYQILYAPPPVVDVFPTTAQFLGFKVFLPIAVLRPVQVSFGTGVGEINVEVLMEKVFQILITHVLAHLLSLSAAIMFLRVAAIVLSQSTVLIFNLSSSLAKFL